MLIGIRAVDYAHGYSAFLEEERALRLRRANRFFHKSVTTLAASFYRGCLAIEVLALLTTDHGDAGQSDQSPFSSPQPQLSRTSDGSQTVSVTFQCRAENERYFRV